ncbi:hypothetical protein E0Z06_13255 [Rheinheimera sp. D18]|uniref:hypothetical protein n=1 Tax=Rheinheimera sp. D18 TaxID=2545632 RepID=UPI0010511013|nr:hypothetical protein [Rheinheimera sp. D18]QBL10427.1 hypothetical protein E0Z06_13255 [Rheinheimera sp. D18]
MKNWSAITKLGFIKTHELKLQNGRFKFLPLIPHEELDSLGFKNKSCVYIWGAERENQAGEIVYVGKAGGGVATRLTQHEGGFVNSGTGKKNLEELSKLMESGCRIYVFSRVAEIIKLFDVDVSLYSTEEEALIERLSPWLNRARNTSNYKNSAIPLGVKVQEISLDYLPHHDEVEAFLDSLAIEDKELFSRLLTWVLDLNATKHLSQKVIGGYTGQPLKMNGKRMLTFAEFGEKGRALPNAWRIRLSLEDNVGVVLPLDFKSPTLEEDLVDIKYNTKAFSPKNVRDFLADPQKYTTLI